MSSPGNGASGAGPFSTADRPSIGIVMRRPARLVRIEPFYMEFIRGLESVLAEHGAALVLQVTSNVEEELGTYRRWHEQHLVSGVILSDLHASDPRIPLLRELAIPTVLVGEPSLAPDFAAVWTDDKTAMARALEHLVALGHRRVARVTGPTELLHTEERTRAFVETLGRLGVEGVIERGDYTEESGATATAHVLDRDPAQRASAIIYDNDVMALAGLDVLNARAVQVPAEISIVAWDDSVQCQLAAMSALSHDVRAYGALTAEIIMSQLGGNPPVARQADLPTLVDRGTIGPAPARRPLRRRDVEV